MNYLKIPESSARYFSAGFEGSVVLEVNGYGVCFSFSLIFTFLPVYCLFSVLITQNLLAFLSGPSFEVYSGDHGKLLGQWYSPRTRHCL
jgi:hypothetical protein